MKIIFFGTPDYVLPVLKSLHKKFIGRAGKSPIVAVVTQSPKPTGRKQQMEYSAVDKWAHERGIQIFYEPSDLLNKNLEANLGISAAYGQLIPDSVLKLFPNGILNIHPSLLPKLRGASPVQSTLVTNQIPGVTIFKLDKSMDHGPIVAQFKDEITKDDTLESLRNRLFERSAKVLVELIEPYIKGKISIKKQDDSLATFTKLVQKSHGFIKGEWLELASQGKTSKDAWEIPFVKEYTLTPTAENLERFIRAVTPWPGAWTEVQLSQAKGNSTPTKRLKILKAHLEDTNLVLDDVQLEGKNPVSWFQFKTAYPEFKLV